MELGCGVGLSGLVALHCCRPKTYFFTDSHEKVLHKVQENLEINGFLSSGEKYNVDGCKNSPTSRGDVHTKKLNSVVHEYLYTDELNPQSEVKIKLKKNCSDEGHVEEQAYQEDNELLGRSQYFKECSSLQHSFRKFSSLKCSEDCETCGECCADNELTNAVVCQLDWQNWTLSEAKQYSADVILAAGKQNKGWGVGLYMYCLPIFQREISSPLPHPQYH